MHDVKKADVVRAAEALRGEAPTDRFAKELGFASYLDLFEGSTPLLAASEVAWCATRLPGGEWVLWNDHDLKEEGRFATQEAALADAKAKSSRASVVANNLGGRS